MTFVLIVRVSRQLVIPPRSGLVDREAFYEWLWSELPGLTGVHEGTVLAEQAGGMGSDLVTVPWTLDSGEAPADRDWINNQAIVEAQFYFGERVDAEAAAKRLSEIRGLEVGAIDEQAPQDWDAQWRASFQGAQVPPFWQVVPPWVEPTLAPGERLLRLNPGAGFGTGTHETTQLCLGAIGELLPRLSLGPRVLDFGSGSGILAVGAALLGARVDGVEIDPLAIDNAVENARLNGVEDWISYERALTGTHDGYEVVIANILRPVLLEFAPELVRRLVPGGVVILSGLLEKDVAEVVTKYAALLARKPSPIRSLNEWRAVVFS